MSPELEHPLLYPKAPAYTNTTVRRAFIVWLKCGQTNQFRDVCDYYHRLEAMEEKLPAELRASSRNHEFSLFVSQPPTTPYQQLLFPQLYPKHETGHQYIPQYEINMRGTVAEDIKTGNKVDDERRYKVSNEDIFEASQMFKEPKPKNETKDYTNVGIHNNVKTQVESNVEMKVNEGKNTLLAFDLQTTPKKTKSSETFSDYSGTTKQEIVKTSLMIKDYCKEHQIPLKNFLEIFKEYADRCELPNTVNNVNCYIKRRMIFEELGLAVKVFRARSNFVEKEKKSVICNIKNTGDDKPKANQVFGIKTTKNQITNETATYRAITKDVNSLNLRNKKCNLDKYIDRNFKILKEEYKKVPNIKFSDSHFVNVNDEMLRKI